MKTDTIFALASGAVPSGIAVIRVSGPGAEEAMVKITGSPLPKARRATRASLRSPASGEVLDQGLVLWFPGPRSFTGEDVAELQVHGGRSVVRGLLEALADLPGLRPAEAGEFSRRAFESGKLDLTEVEGLADLVHAETAAQRRQALRQMGGALGELYESWRARLLRGQAHFEATIDFSDEDLPADVEQGVRADMAAVAEEIAVHLRDDRRGEILRDGLRIAIIGPPNAGKSSLLNLLARREVAIVSETAGTTRDVIEVHLDLGGYPVVVADTAGLRDGGDAIEREGMRRALVRAEEADLRLAVLDAEAWPDVDPALVALMGGETLGLLNKIDRRRPEDPTQIGGRDLIPVSAKTGEGVDRLLDRLQAAVTERCGGQGGVSLTRVRHRRALEDCRDALDRLDGVGEAELAAEELRLAARALGTITGRVEVEALLDVIFGDFCIGK